MRSLIMITLAGAKRGLRIAPASRAAGPASRRRRGLAVPLLAAAAVLTVPLASLAASATAVAQTPPPVSAGIGPGLLPDPASITPADENRCADVAYKAGFSYTTYVHANDGHAHRSILIAVAICLAESGGDPYVYLCNPSLRSGDYPPVSCDAGDRSYDRGLWQINSAAWQQVSNDCAFQKQCNGDAAWGLISNHGTNFCPWVTYANPNDCSQPGSWVNYLNDASDGLSNFTLILQDEGTGTCLDAQAQTAGNGGVIQQYLCNSSDSFQQWHVIQGAGNLEPVLRNVGTGTCLDAEAQQPNDRGTIFQWECDTTGDSHQQWRVDGSGGLHSNGDAVLLLRNVGNNTCLAADASDPHDGGKIWQWTCNSANTYLQWN
jgi:Lysozyme like domain/Ricin-type beta-trefoil lectin domain